MMRTKIVWKNRWSESNTKQICNAQNQTVIHSYIWSFASQPTGIPICGLDYKEKHIMLFSHHLYLVPIILLHGMSEYSFSPQKTLHAQVHPQTKSYSKNSTFMKAHHPKGYSSNLKRASFKDLSTNASLSMRQLFFRRVHVPPWNWNGKLHPLQKTLYCLAFHFHLVDPLYSSFFKTVNIETTFMSIPAYFEPSI
jgi:hypothetical protein